MRIQPRVYWPYPPAAAKEKVSQINNSFSKLLAEELYQLVKMSIGQCLLS